MEMKNGCIILFLIILCHSAIAQLDNREIKDLKTGRVIQDTSFVYRLPYELDKKPLFVQGANGRMSHKNEISFDFKMKKGTVISAARSGKVIRTKKDSKVGGLRAKYYNDGNHVVIKHDDGSRAYYWHLSYDGVTVKVGDEVVAGQTIGYSGNTGYSAFPHLHFQIVDDSRTDVLPRFYTRKGIRYLRPGRRYKSVQANQLK